MSVTLDKPKFQHDCDCCTFLGRSEDGAMDLYHCKSEFEETIIARYGKDGEYLSGMVFKDRNPYLGQAYKRAVERGLIK